MGYYSKYYFTVYCITILVLSGIVPNARVPTKVATVACIFGDDETAGVNAA